MILLCLDSSAIKYMQTIISEYMTKKRLYCELLTMQISYHDA